MVDFPARTNRMLAAVPLEMTALADTKPESRRVLKVMSPVARLMG